ncbi:unnamed protein product [Vicia faba]|uniref:Pectinesterase inhibitor domain-containing protein n=1 Tax=Vicia faba TaxID=3906 RepID=A0AAV1ANS7_VICFA|nr:unnamed protein product [Vicia faba]
MKKTSAFMSFFQTLLFSCLFLQLTQSSTQMNDIVLDDLVDDMCKKTPNFDLCSSTIHSNPQAGKSDANGIAVIMVNGILQSVTNTLSFIQGLVKETKDPELQRKYVSCAETYIPLEKTILPQAVDSINKKKYGLAIFSMGFIGKEIDSCNKQFSNSSPLNEKTGSLHQLLDIGTAILKQL